MNRTWRVILALAVAVIYGMTAGSQPPGQDNRGPGAPGRGGPGGQGGPGGGGGPRFELGRVLPPFARQQLNLTKDQEEQIAKLEQEVKDRLSKILTEDQKKKLENLRPPGPGGGRGGPGGPPGGRPGGPGGDPDANRPNPPDKRDKPNTGEKLAKSATAGGIQWFATWASGLQEATRTGRPILLVSAAPHCAGVPGIW